jgi:hypothetical protein
LAQDAPGISDFYETFQLSVDEERLRNHYLQQQVNSHSIEQDLIDGRNNNEPEFGGEEPHQIDYNVRPIVRETYYGEDEEEEEESAEPFVNKDVAMHDITEFLNRKEL